MRGRKSLLEKHGKMGLKDFEIFDFIAMGISVYGTFCMFCRENILYMSSYVYESTTFVERTICIRLHIYMKASFCIILIMYMNILFCTFFISMSHLSIGPFFI